MKKLTNDQKRAKDRFVAQYFGQKVLHNGIEIVYVEKSWNWQHPSFKLHLTPLQNISDEHAIEVAKIITKGINQHGWSVNRENKPIIWLENSADSDIDFNISNDNIIETGYHVDIINYLQVFEFLKSKSYTTPHYCPIENRIIPVQEQIDNGWIALKTE